MTLSFKFNDKLEKKVLDYCYDNWLTINKFMNKCWLSWNTWYVAKKRWVIWINSLYKIRRLIEDLDIHSLDRK